MQSVPITTEALSWYPAHCEVYSINHYAIRFVSDLGMIVFFSLSPVSSNSKTDRHHITEILLKVALNTIIPARPLTQATIVDLKCPVRRFWFLAPSTLRYLVLQFI